jgi:hypothetical protein
MKISPREGAQQLHTWRNPAYKAATAAMHTAAEKTALQAIGRDSLQGTTDEQRVIYQDTYDYVLRSLMNDTPLAS